MTSFVRRPSGIHRIVWPLSACLFFFAATAHAAPAHDAFARALAKGPLYAALASLASGLLVSLTPCVYPMIAVTVSVFGAKEVKSRRHGAMLSAFFVLGIVTMFVPLGVVAGLTGSIFGSALQNRWVTIGIAALFLAMAASMFGAFELALPSSITNRLATMGGIGYKGAFVLGLVCGPIAAPCTGPFLTGILAWIAKTQSVVLGAGAMAAFALGLGAPFFVVGAFAVQLPKSGRWMVHIKSILGLVLVVVALYVLNNSFPAMSRFASPSMKFLAIAGAVAVVGLLLGAVHRSFDEPGAGVKIAKGTGIVLTSVASFLFIVGAIKPARTLSWEQVSVAEARAQALRQDRPLLVDFGATWCGACKELDKKTFSEPSVKREAGRFIAVHVDASDDDDPKVAATLHRFHVLGLPTVLVFDSSGKEALRYTRFVEPSEFLAAISKVN
jgi:thioredoxin:protein disulfide reductase